MRRMFLAAAVSGGLALAGAVAAAHEGGPMEHGQMSHAAMAGHQAVSAPAAANDACVQVVFPTPLAARTLANMRDHLMALAEINAALAHGDNGKAAKIAEARLGLSSLELHDADEAARCMPLGMQTAGAAMHRAASRFAVAAQDAEVTGDLKPALAAVTEACVACHAGFRLNEPAGGGAGRPPGPDMTTPGLVARALSSRRGRPSGTWLSSARPRASCRSASP